MEQTQLLSIKIRFKTFREFNTPIAAKRHASAWLELHEKNKKVASSPYLVTHLTPFGKLLYYDVQNAKNNSNTH